MKKLEVDDALYQYVASQTQSIGESASDILRRLLCLPAQPLDPNFDPAQQSLDFSSQNDMKFSESVPRKKTKKINENTQQQLIERIQKLIKTAAFQEESKAVVRFLAILRVLYRTDPEHFAQAVESIEGRTRIYFARDEATLLAAGNHTKPKQIPDTPYWVITNTNSGRKMLMLEGAMQSMHLPQDLIEQVRQYFTAN